MVALPDARLINLAEAAVQAWIERHLGRGFMTHYANLD